MKHSLIYAFLLAFQCATAAGQDGAVFGNGGSYGSGYRIGVAEAEQQLDARQATIYIYGLRGPGEFLDRRSGLPLEPIAGCVVDNTILGAPTGITTLYLDKTQREEPNGTVSAHLSLLIMRAGNDRKRYDLFYEGDVDCVWGPEGAPFAVVRINTTSGATLEALDVSRGKLLRAEYPDRAAR